MVPWQWLIWVLSSVTTKCFILTVGRTTDKKRICYYKTFSSLLVNFSILTRICHSVNKGTFSLLLYNEGRGISFFFFFFLDSFVIFCSFSCSTEGTTWNLHPWLIDYTLECSGPPSWRCDPRQAYQNHSLGALEMNLRKETLFKSDSDDKKTRASAGPVAMTLASWRKLGWKIGSDIHKKKPMKGRAQSASSLWHVISTVS